MEAAAPHAYAGRFVLCRLGWWLGCAALLALAGCAVAPRNIDEVLGGRDGAPPMPPDVSKIPDAVPHREPLSKYGNPPSYQVAGRTYYVMASSHGYRERGVASWYGTKFHGRRTSSGEPYDMYSMTAAHRTLPLPTYVRVTNLRNERSVVLRVNDRGPFHADRVIDLSYAAAARLGILGPGTGLVEVTALNPDAPDEAPNVATRLASSGPVAGSLEAAPTAARAPQTPRAKAPAAQSHDPALFLQVGAFMEASNAERLQSRLLHALLEAPTRITEASAASRPIYRVRVGPLDSVQQADSLAERLRAMGIAETRIVVD